LAEKPSLVLVLGDTNSALDGTICSVKSGVKLAHLESGARSYDMKMAEEINRRINARCASILFAPTENCKRNLEDEKVTGEIIQSGDTMYDVFVCFEEKAEKNNIVDKLGLSDQKFAVLTTHRAENVDYSYKLRSLFSAIQAAQIPIVFPVHPRTRQRLRANNISLENTCVPPIDPISYIDACLA